MAAARAGLHEHLQQAGFDTYEALNVQLAEKSHVVLDLAENVRLFSLNALLAATRLGSDGASLGAVASLMQTRSNQSDPHFQSLMDDLARLSRFSVAAEAALAQHSRRHVDIIRTQAEIAGRAQ